MKLNRVSLNVVGLNRIGLNRIGSPSRRGSSGTDRPYIDSEVLTSLKAVCICYGKSNDDPDRAVVKNLVDPDNPFVISNAAYDKMSSYGGYEFAKFDNTLDWYNTEGNDSVEVVSRNGHSITLKRLTGPNFWYFQNSTFRGLISNVIPFKVNSNKNITVIWDVHGLSISEGKDKSVRVQELVLNPNEDNYTNLKTLNEEELAQIDISTNSLYYLLWFDLSTLAVDEEVTIEMLPQFEGAFVTDGIDDLITSTKTVQEMGVTDEVTVVSMIHQITLNSTYNVGTTNYLENLDNGKHIRSDVYYAGKTGIYGYTASLINNTASDIKNILGDKADYSTQKNEPSQTLHNSKFSVVGRARNLTEPSSVAWYWTIIANKVLTTDQINQVIAYFNLDRTLNPDILCDTIKQGITNENHAEFGDKLIDYSGNGRDIQLNNIAWKGDSGIGKYATDFTSWTTPKEVQKTSDTVKITTEYTEHWVAYLAPNNTFKSMKVLISGIPDGGALQFFRTTADGGGIKMVNGINEIPEFTNTVAAGFYIDVPLGFDWSNLVIEQIPSHAGALCLDGVNDFGKVTGMPIYKDYTVIADYIRISAKENAADAPILSKSKVINNGAFLFNYLNVSSTLNSYSFGTNNMLASISDSERKIYYQSKYVNEGKSINSGTGTDYDSMWLGIYRDNAQNFFNGAIYSLMSFPYSMSKFLIERQLKKHKLGTLYPDMVEWRPIIKSNIPYSSITYSVNPGEYISVDSMVTITVTLPNTSDKLMEVSCNAISDISISGDNGVYEITGKVVKSPQKINIVISSYLTMLNNETLISNETLIKNE